MNVFAQNSHNPSLSKHLGQHIAAHLPYEQGFNFVDTL